MLGFALDPDLDETARTYGVDWMQAIELAARYMASRCQQGGDGTFDPYILPRDA